MNTSLKITEPTALDPVITVTEMRDHLNFTESAPEVDSMLQAWIEVWEERIEEWTGRALREQTYTYKLDKFKPEIVLPRSPVRSISSIKYYNGSNVLTTMVEGTDFEVDLDSDECRIRALPGTSWPITYDRYLPVEIVFVAGYGGEDGPTIPKKLVQLIKLEVSSCFKYRATLVDQEPKKIPTYFAHSVILEASAGFIC